jgi:hypothetical protein
MQVIMCAALKDRQQNEGRVNFGLLINRTVLVSLTLGMVFSGPSKAIGDATTFRVTIGSIEQTLKRAAIESPQWHQRQDSIQRDVRDITFLLQQSLLSAKNPQYDHAGKTYYAQEALLVLERATTVGNLDTTMMEPVFALIKQLLKD